MAKRTISVTAEADFTFEIDDEAVSDWDGAKILEVLDKRADNDPPIYARGAELKELLGDLGIQLCVDNRYIDSIDGWADFPRAAASGNPYGVHWHIEQVKVDGKQVRG